MRNIEEDEDYPSVSPARGSSSTSTAALVLGGISVVIGILAVMFSLGLSLCCFILGWATVPFSAIGLTLGIIGLIIPLATKSRGIGLPIAGMSVNGLALLIVMVSQIFGFAFFSRPAPVMPSPNPPIIQPKKPSPPPIDTVTDGDVKVTITSAERVAGNRLAIHLKIENLSPTRTVTFKGWNLGKEVGKVRWLDLDEIEHPLELVDAELNLTPQHTFSRDVTLTETLAFDALPDDFVLLKLELPATNYGGKGKIRFVIPFDKVKK